MMKAIGYKASLPITEPDALIDIELPKPTATGRDLLVKIHAIAVNPVDYKVRQRAQPQPGQIRILGWDAVGEVVEVGSEVQNFKIGDQVYYAGDITRQGCNAEYQLIDERLVGNKPSTLSNAEAAALPLTTMTAWEILFDHFHLNASNTQNPSKKEILLIMGGAGGVGSILIQLAKLLTQATIITTASRPESIEWVKKLGADYVINHHHPMKQQLEELGIQDVTHIASLHNTEHYLDQFQEIIRPFGKICMIDDPIKCGTAFLEQKSLSLHHEYMFASSTHKTDDMIKQSQLLNTVSSLIDQGKIKTTLGKNLGKINAKNLKKAHILLENQTMVGKIVLEGF